MIKKKCIRNAGLQWRPSLSSLLCSHILPSETFNSRGAAGLIERKRWDLFWLRLQPRRHTCTHKLRHPGGVLPFPKCRQGDRLSLWQPLRGVRIGCWLYLKELPYAAWGKCYTLFSVCTGCVSWYKCVCQKTGDLSYYWLLPPVCLWRALSVLAGVSRFHLPQRLVKLEDWLINVGWRVVMCVIEWNDTSQGVKH